MTKIQFVQFVNPVGPLQQAQSYAHKEGEREISLDDKQRFFEVRRKHHSGKWESVIVPMQNVASFQEKVEEVKPQAQVKK